MNWPWNHASEYDVLYVDPDKKKKNKDKEEDNKKDATVIVKAEPDNPADQLKLPVMVKNASGKPSLLDDNWLYRCALIRSALFREGYASNTYVPWNGNSVGNNYGHHFTCPSKEPFEIFLNPDTIEELELRFLIK